MSSDLQNKLFHFEANPPKEIWNKIAGALDEEDIQVYPQRLFSYEEQPPSQLWNKIEASLESVEPPVKIIPITRFKKPLRYVAAAASIIAVVMLITNLNGKKTIAGAAIGKTETVSPTQQSSILPTESNVPTKESEKTQSTTVFSTSTEQKRTEEGKIKRKILAFIRPRSIISSFSFSQHFIPKKVNKENSFDFSEMDNYMIYSDGNGTAMKVPKKLFSVVNCKDGDYSCQERIKQLQFKMASAAITNDFGGVLEILRQLQ